MQPCDVAGFTPAPAHCPSATVAIVGCSTHVTERVCVPPPHMTEHVPNALLTHWYVHGCTEQLCDVAGFGPAPAHCTSVAAVIEPSSRHVTVLVCVPGPHTVEHVPNAPVTHW